MRRDEATLICSFFQDEDFSDFKFTLRVRNQTTLTGVLTLDLFSCGKPMKCPLLHKDHGFTSIDNFECIVKYCFDQRNEVDDNLQMASYH